MQRRQLLQGALCGLAGGLLGPAARSAAAPEDLKEIRIAYQKSGIFPAVRARKTLESAFSPQGVSIKWIEFAFGPPILEAINTGNADYGYTGDAPPVFAQAANANLVYVAALPRQSAEAIIVHADSPIRSLADLKGKKIGFAKASSAHNTTVAALEKAGLSYSDIQPVMLPPADAFAAFARGSIDAWTIWDPYLALAQKGDVRVIAFAADVHDPNSFFLANKDFAAKYPQTVARMNQLLADESAWAEGHRAEMAEAIHAASGVDLDALKVAVSRYGFKVVPMNDAIIKSQQAVADRFLKLGLIPREINVRDIVWTWTQAS